MPLAETPKPVTVPITCKQPVFFAGQSGDGVFLVAPSTFDLLAVAVEKWKATRRGDGGDKRQSEGRGAGKRGFAVI